MTVKKKRHIAKAFTWRIIASITTGLIAWIITGKMELGMSIGALDVIIKLVLYYLHERAWYHSTFGVVYAEETKNPLKKSQRI
jgi:uncharacterized membrane protein